MFHIRSAIREIALGLTQLYGDYPKGPPREFADFHVSLDRPKGPRRWIRPQVVFHFDGEAPFKPLPLDQALPMLEWGMNWCVAAHAHQFLIIHAAAVARNGVAAILPAPPGSGKSTLCAALINRGWRLLSDELALLSLDDGTVVPLARPISLKNESIGVIRGFVPDAVIGRESRDTTKGTVALLKAPKDSIERMSEIARPAWIIFPRFEAGAEPSLVTRSKADTCMEIGDNAFNYSIHGARGFNLLCQIVDGCACYDFKYGELDAAIEVFDSLCPRT